MRIVLALCLLAVPLRAQDVTVRHSIDRDTVAVGESVTYVIEVSSSGNLRASNPEPPRLPGVQVVSSGTSDNIQFVNGEVSATRVYQFGLIPKKAGTFTIGPAKVDVNGTVKKAEAEVSFKAIPEAHGAGPAEAPPAAPDEEDPAEEPPPQARQRQQTATTDRSLFVRASVSKTRVYQGEPLVYTSSLYSQHAFLSGTGIKQDASFPGFVVEAHQADNRARTVREGNAMYYRADISRRVLVPTKSGMLSITPETLQVALRVRGRRQADPYDPFGGQFEDPFGMFTQPQIRHVSAPGIDVEVLPLPDAGKPADFTGAVGTEFFVASALDKDTLKENEVLTLRFTVKGRGDVRGVQEPRLAVGNEFKLFPAKATPKLDVTAEGLVGTKVFEIVLAPRGTGEKVIPGVKFSYFDTDQYKYVTKSTQAVKITVTPGEKAEVLTNVGTLAGPREDIKVLGRDLQFIKEDPSGLASTPELVRQPVFWASNLVPLGLVLLVWFWTAKRDRLESDVAWARRSRAYSAARKGLAELFAGVAKLDTRAFYARLDQVLLEFVAGKLNRAAAGLTQEQVRDALLAAAVEDRLVNRVSELLSRGEEMRFAPGAGGGASARTGDLDAAGQVLAELEGVLT